MLDSWKNIFLGANDAFSVIVFKWRSMTGKHLMSSIVMGGVFLLMLFITLSFTHALYFAHMMLTSNSYTTIPATSLDTIRDFYKTLASTNGAFIISVVFWSILSSLILLPAVGYTTSTIIPSTDLVIVKRNNYFRLMESVLLQLLSSISLLQFISLTIVGSLLGYKSEHPGVVILFMWGVWLFVVVISSMLSWFFELVHKKWGVKVRLLCGGGIFLVLGLSILLVHNAVTSLWGMAKPIGKFLSNMSFNAESLVAFIVLGVLILGALMLTSILGTVTLALPEISSGKKISIVDRLLADHKGNDLSLYSFFIRIVLKESNLRKPFFMSLIFLALMGFGANFFSQWYMFIVGAILIPLISAITWSINIFGILAGGTSWLVSLPGIKRKILPVSLLLQGTLMTILTGAFIIPRSLIGGFTFHDLTVFFLSLLAAGSILSVISVKRSVRSPERYRVQTRGEGILPPIKAITYMFLFFVIGFIICIAIQMSLNIWMQIGLTLLLVSYATVRLIFLQRYWMHDPKIVNKIISIIS